MPDDMAAAAARGTPDLGGDPRDGRLRSARSPPRDDAQNGSSGAPAVLAAQGPGRPPGAEASFARIIRRRPLRLLGVFGTSWLTVRLTGAHLNPLLAWPDIAGIGVLAGTGFTVCLLFADLSYDNTAHLTQAKSAALLALCLRLTPGRTDPEPPQHPPPPPTTTDGTTQVSTPTRTISRPLKRTAQEIVSDP
jgi:hypothetical protein